MKQKNETNLIPLILAGILLITGGAAYMLDFVRFSFSVGHLNVAVYPAAFLMLAGMVLFWWTIFKESRQS